jgi:ferredoxin
VLGSEGLLRNRTPLRNLGAMSLAIDSAKCQGHGRCVLINPDLFDVDDDGYGLVLVAEPGPDVQDDVQRAIESCPELAISFS